MQFISRIVQRAAARRLLAGRFAGARRLLSAYNGIARLLRLQRKPLSLGLVLKTLAPEALFTVYSGRGSVLELEQYLLCLPREARRSLVSRMLQRRQYHAAYRILQKDSSLRRETLRQIATAPSREQVNAYLRMWQESGDTARLLRELGGKNFPEGAAERAGLWLQGNGVLASAAASGPAAAGPYRLLKEAGRGASGIVYEAVDTRTGKRLALRRIWHDVAAGEEAREFLRTAALQAVSLDHPAIIPVSDVLEINGFVWIASEFSDGETLAARLRRSGALPLDDVRRFMRQVCEAVDYAHARDIVHGSIKPSNIMLENENARLADFGMPLDPARKLDDGNESALYRVPGQKGIRHESRGDIYAVGIVLYEMLTGDLPFRIPRSAVEQSAAGSRPSARLFPGLSHAAEGIIATCLQAEREQRSVSARDLAMVIETL